MTRQTVTGRVFDIQHFCVQDGPGIRTTVFFQGCPLRCLWCHNPEGMDGDSILSYCGNKCIGCGECAAVCELHTVDNSGHTIDRIACRQCFRCVSVCLPGALSVVGREMTVDDIMADVLGDRRFYEHGSGGVTFSGGEPLAQPEFLRTLCASAKGHKLHVAVETSGFSKFDNLAAILPDVDLFLFDWKESNPALHRKYTGVDNELIQENLCRLHDQGALIRLRCPIIIGLNDRDEHFEGIAELAKRLPNLAGVELLAYHDLASTKNGRMGLDSQSIYQTPTMEHKKLWQKKLAELNINVIKS